MSEERREGLRKVLRVRAIIQIAEHAAEVRTHDISLTGICLLLPFPSKLGGTAKIQFSLFHDGVLKELTVSGKAMHSSLSADKFRTGFSFTVISPEHFKIIANYCRDR